ncbi:hypothetical protein [Burkholderia sp. AW49-1]
MGGRIAADVDANNACVADYLATRVRADGESETDGPVSRPLQRYAFIQVPFVANPEPSECMKRGKGTFDEPAFYHGHCHEANRFLQARA